MDKIRLGYIFRIDDITPGMNRDNFDKIEKIFDTYGVKPIIGVVPDNQDRKLDGFGHISNFREKTTALHKKGRTIVQHGYQHKYTTKHSGIIGLNAYSEFAGLAYDEQLQKIEKGKEIIERNLGIKIKRWMAPAHSFDKTTCKVLKKLGFTHITDGIALYPFEKYGLKWLPQQIWKPTKKHMGIWTICLHINTYKDRDIKEIESFIRAHEKEIIQDIEQLRYKNKIGKTIMNQIFKPIFWAKIYLYRIKKKLLG